MYFIHTILSLLASQSICVADDRMPVFKFRQSLGGVSAWMQCFKGVFTQTLRLIRLPWQCQSHFIADRSTSIYSTSSLSKCAKTISVMLFSVMTWSSVSYSHAAEFATDVDSILLHLSKPVSSVRSANDLVSKGVEIRAKSTQSPDIRVLQEVEKGGVMTRNFAVVERQENASRVSLRIEFDIDSANLRPNLSLCCNHLCRP